MRANVRRLPYIERRSVGFTVLALLSLAACSSDSDVRKAAPIEEERVFGEEERMAARALSTSDLQAVESAGGAYEQALLCRHAISVLTDFMEQTDGLDEQQMQGANEFEAYLDRQLQLAAGEEGKSDRELSLDLRRVAEENQETSPNLRIALACLQRLQGAG